MRIINKTPWKTDHLRAFAMEVAKRTLDPEHRKGMVIEFRNSRSRGVAGHAYYHQVRWSHGPMKKYGWCRYARITLPTGRLSPSRQRFIQKWDAQPTSADHQAARASAIAGWIEKSTPNKRALASVLEHEMLHTIGQKHPGEHGSHVMRGHYDDETLGERYEWADTMPLEHT